MIQFYPNLYSASGALILLALAICIPIVLYINYAAKQYFRSTL
jgi:hypothetical protein